MNFNVTERSENSMTALVNNSFTEYYMNFDKHLNFTKV